MTTLMKCLALLLLPLLAILSSGAQPTTQAAGEKVVLLMTFGPGDEVYERWGHNAIVIINPVTKEQTAYHYGVFDFDQPNFIGRFILGRMLYAMGIYPAEFVDAWIQDYIANDRDVWMQKLNLTQPQINRLQAFLEENYKKENRNYLYEYYRANCSTKVRDALDYATAGQLQQQWGQVWTDSSYRRLTRIGSADFPFVYTGLSFVLSSNVDRPITLWDKAFVPMLLREQLSHLEINGAPFVSLEKQLHTSKHLQLVPQPPQWIRYYLGIGLAIGGTMLWCGFRFSRSKWSDRVMLLMGMAWSFLAGFGGLFLLFAWFCTDHISAHANQNLLLFSPLSMGMFVLLPLAVKGRPKGKWALPLARILLLLAVLSLVVKIGPVPRQWNWEMIALALPAHLGLMLALTPGRKFDDSRPRTAESVVTA